MIPIKKRNQYFPNSSQMVAPLRNPNSAPSILTNTSKTSSDGLSSLDLTDWHKRRVLALYRRSFSESLDDKNKQLSASYPGHYSNSKQLDLFNGDELFYYPATIENTNCSLVTVVFDASIEQVLSDNSVRSLSRISVDLASSQPSLGSYAAKNYQHTFDVARDEKKYSIIDDAQADASNLEKDMLVLYRSTSGFTPNSSMPTSPSNYKASGGCQQLTPGGDKVNR